MAKSIVLLEDQFAVMELVKQAPAPGHAVTQPVPPVHHEGKGQVCNNRPGPSRDSAEVEHAGIDKPHT